MMIVWHVIVMMMMTIMFGRASGASGAEQYDASGTTRAVRREWHDASGTTRAARRERHDASGTTRAVRRKRYDASGTTRAVRCKRHDASGTTRVARRERHDASGTTRAVRHERHEQYLLYDVLRLDVDDAHLARHVHQVVLRYVEARRSQPVAVEDRADVTTVGERQERCSRHRVTSVSARRHISATDTFSRLHCTNI